MRETFFLPESIQEPEIFQYDEWTPESFIQQINKQTKHIERLKPKVEDVIMLFWVAHEKIVNKHIDWTDWTWGKFCEECGYSVETPRVWFKKYGLSVTKTAGRKESNSNFLELDNPTKKQTKPVVKFQLEQTVQAIKEEQISDDDLKKVGDALADRIKEGAAAPRVGTRVNTAVKQTQKKKGVPEPKEIDNFERIRKSIRHSIEGLTAWADKRIKPETEDEAIAARAILASGANMVIQYARLGLDIQGILQTFVEGDSKNELSEEEKFHRAKQVN